MRFMKCLGCHEKWPTNLPATDPVTTYCPFCLRQQTTEIDATIYEGADHRHRWDQDLKDWAWITVFFIGACIFLAFMIGVFNKTGGR